MEQIELGKTGLKVGRLGLGAGPFGGEQEIKKNKTNLPKH